MYLTSVDIVGFKSFSEPTRIEFHEGVTAIVGPNGSGKSNITDAIRWVLGEQSTNELRAGRMADVVFSGTQSKRALGFAEVTIHFNNADGQLPIEFSDVAVTRRYFRSGESEYEINGAACRLKDIVALFMDTGIGKDGYSIIGQGKVDQILSPRGDERRQIFDEASGIVKFKTRKNEALRKLEQTDTNLTRLDDILGELSLRLGPLQKQAADARTYLKHAEALKTLDIWYADSQVKVHEAALDALRCEIDDALAATSAADIKLAGIRAAYEAAGARLDALEQDADLLRTRHDQASGVRAGVLAEKSRAELAEEHARDRLAALAADKARSQAALDAGTGDDSEQQAKKKTLNQLLIRYRADMAEKKVRFDNAVAAAQDAARKKQQVRAELDAVRQENFEAKNRLIEIETELLHLERQMGDVETSGADQRGDRSRLAFQVESWQDDLAKAKKQADSDAAALDRARTEVESIRARLLEAQRRLAEQEAAAAQYDYRARLLADLERQNEGYSGVVKRIEAQRRERPDMGEGVHGPYAGLLEVSDGFELAVEIALGAAANHIVTDNQKTASRWIDWLKTTRGGRATFLPLAEMKAWPLDPAFIEKVRDKPGYLGTAEEAVSVRPELNAVTGRLLGRTLVADTLANALAIFNAVDRMVRVVTLEGELLSPGGSMSGGYDARTGAGVISRKNEQKKLAVLLEANKTAMASTRSDIGDWNDRLETAMREAAHDENVHLEAVRALESAVHKAAEGARALDSLNRAAAAWTEKIAGLKRQIEAKRAAKTETESAVNRLTQREHALADALAADTEPAAGNEASLDDLRQDLSDLRVNVTSVEESLRSMDAIEAHRRQAIDGERMRQAAIAADEAREKQALAEAGRTIALTDETLAELQQTLDGLTSEVMAKQAERQRLESERHRHVEALEQEGETRGTLLLAAEKLESKRERIVNQIDDLRNRLWEQYELVAEDIVEIETPDLPGLTPAKAAREIAALRAKIKDIGPVSPAAIDELADVVTRVDAFRVQRDDMQQARNELETVIRDLDRAMKAQFKDGFEKIAAAFTQVFRELFNGGDATLELTEDADLLESDIVIRAQPPGKKMQSLNPLSGGERSLTAIALLFAIMRQRPAPFCVFDEIESSLDDANVLRFADYIRKYSKTTQFVLVTHRKGTMESADRLYGVTMQERGVSTILSMQLDTPGAAR